jgi:hypothetical protein
MIKPGFHGFTHYDSALGKILNSFAMRMKPGGLYEFTESE